MSIREMAEVWYATNLAPNQRLVALALADFADDHGRCYPSLRTIGAKTGYSRKNTQRLVRQLSAIGYVEIMIPATWNRTPLYQLHSEILERAEIDEIRQPPLPAHELLEPAPEEDTVEDNSGGDNLGPRDPEAGTQEGTPPSPGGPEAGTQTVIEPSVEPSDESVERFTDEMEVTSLRPRNRGWDALEALFGYRPTEKAERSLWGAIAARANETPDPEMAVATRAYAIVNNWGPSALTAPSFKKHWDWAGSAVAQMSETDAARMRDHLDREKRRRRAAELEATERGALEEGAR